MLGSNNLKDTMQERIDIKPILESDIENILLIADDVFGKGYIGREELATFLNNDDKFCKVAKIEGIVVGFGLTEICEAQNLYQIILKDYDWIENFVSKERPIAVMKTFAVRTDYQKKGIGTQLIIKSLEKLSNISVDLLAVCWEHDKDVELGTILDQFGMNPIRKIAGYWHKDSVLRNYTCASCGTPPCNCSALIYAK